MLRDSSRTSTYKKAIFDNAHLFDGKIVLDIGCGTGILSIFAAKAGARHVYAVDCSDIIHTAADIVKINGLEGKITLLKGKIEDIELPVEKVDIILSEWQGFFLLAENMLSSVIYARKKYLAPDGFLLPEKATIYLAAVENEEHRKSK